jgi:hypothetical protein
LQADAEFQAFAVHLYERATKRPLILGKLSPADVIKRYPALAHELDSAAETSTSGADYDRVVSALRNLGITLRSPRLRTGTFVDALGLATHGVAWSADYVNKPFDVAKAVQTFAPELQLLDSIDPQPELFRTGVVAAALLALSLDASTLEFFSRLSQARGKDGGDHANPSRKLLALINRMKKPEAGDPSALREQELCSMTLQAVERWKRPKQAAGSDLTTTALKDLLKRTVTRVRDLKAANNAQ